MLRPFCLVTLSSRLASTAVAMSGGVDSSVAAWQALTGGARPFSFTFSPTPVQGRGDSARRCCGSREAWDALRVSEMLGMKHYAVGGAGVFSQQVLTDFVSELRQGRTPNPCAKCNQIIKFGWLLDTAVRLGADCIATGHYARISQMGGRHLLYRGCDRRKDQSYFLFGLSQAQLSKTRFPLGEFTKDEVRAIARSAGLPTASKSESMDICFVPSGDYGTFLRDAGHVASHRGDIVDTSGKVVGQHDGIEFFTVGQRRGLRVATPDPLYVTELDSVQNRVLIGPPAALECKEFLVGGCNWIPFDEPQGEFEVEVRIRYNHSGTPATISPVSPTQVRVKLHSSQRAVTPGQAAVCYQGDLVVGGGWIERRV